MRQKAFGIDSEASPLIFIPSHLLLQVKNQDINLATQVDIIILLK